MARLFTLGVVNAIIVPAVHWTEFWAPFPEPTLTIVLVASTKCNFCGQTENVYALRKKMKGELTLHTCPAPSHRHVYDSLSETLDTPVLSQGESVIHINCLPLFFQSLFGGKKRHRVQVK